MTDEFYNNNNQQETENYEGNEQYSEGTATVDNEEPVTDTSSPDNYYTVPVDPVNTDYTQDS